MKKFKIYAVCFFIFGSLCVKGQKLYFDPVTFWTLVGCAYLLEKAQDKTIEQQQDLIDAQGLTTLQIKKANETQKNLYNGLKNIPKTIKKLNIVEQIKNGVSNCYTHVYDISKLVEKHPGYKEYRKYANEFLKQATGIERDLERVLKPASDNLATAGDRYRLIFNMSEKVNEIKRSLCSIKRTIELKDQIDRAYHRKNEKILINYTDRDKKIMEDVMKEYKNKF